MTTCSARFPSIGTTLLLLTSMIAVPLYSQSTTVSLSPDAWTATDSIRSLTYLSRPALYINRGVALVKGVGLDNGTVEMDVAASDTTNFLGVVFRAANPRFSNVVFLRPSQTGTIEAVQYGPAFNSLGVAWQVYHWDGANAAVDLARNKWIHLKVELDGPVARVFVDTLKEPAVVVPRVAVSGGTAIGVWTGAFGRGAYFSNVHYSASSSTAAAPASEAPPKGTLVDWQLSNAIEAAGFQPSTLPDLKQLTWQPVSVEPEGFVLVNRYREAPVGGTPRDSTGAVLVDSVMTGKMAASKIVYARTTISAPRDELRRLQYSYSNGVVIYLNGKPLAFAMNPSGLRGPLGVMAKVGDAVYLPLKKGKNDLVMAVIQATGGWAYSARLD